LISLLLEVCHQGGQCLHIRAALRAVEVDLENDEKKFFIYFPTFFYEKIKNFLKNIVKKYKKSIFFSFF
jgi:hypothetical protein